MCAEEHSFGVSKSTIIMDCRTIMVIFFVLLSIVVDTSVGQERVTNGEEVPQQQVGQERRNNGEKVPNQSILTMVAGPKGYIVKQKSFYLPKDEVTGPKREKDEGHQQDKKVDEKGAENEVTEKVDEKEKKDEGHQENKKVDEKVVDNKMTIKVDGEVDEKVDGEVNEKVNGEVDEKKKKNKGRQQDKKVDKKKKNNKGPQQDKKADEKKKLTEFCPDLPEPTNEKEKNDYRMFKNTDRGIYYNSKGCVTCGDGKDDELMVGPGKVYNKKDQTMLCVDELHLTYGDYKHIANYKVPKTAEQKSYVRCLIKKFMGNLVNDDLTVKYKKAAGVALNAIKFLNFGILSKYLYPGEKITYTKKGINLDEFQNKFLQLMKAYVEMKAGEEGSDPVDNLMNVLTNNENYEYVIQNAFIIRVTRLEYEKETKVENKIT